MVSDDDGRDLVWADDAREELRAAGEALSRAFASYTEAVLASQGDKSIPALELAAVELYSAVEDYEDAHHNYTGLLAPFVALRPIQGPPTDEDGDLIATDRLIAEAGDVRCRLLWARRYSTGLQFCLGLYFRSDRPWTPPPQLAETGLRAPLYDEPREEDANWWIEVVLPDGRSGRWWADPSDDDGEERTPHGNPIELFGSGGSKARGGGQVSNELSLWMPLDVVPPSVTFRTAWEDGGLGVTEMHVPTV